MQQTHELHTGYMIFLLPSPPPQKRREIAAFIADTGQKKKNPEEMPNALPL